MYLGVPLLGWGLGDLIGFFAAGPRMGYAVVVLLLAIGIGWQAHDTPAGFRGGNGQETALVPRQRLVKHIVVLMLYAGLLLVPLSDRWNLFTMPIAMPLRWTGVALFAAGIGMVFWSGVALGRLYSGDVALQEDHHLITRGPYRFIRHPRYSGGIALAFGVSLVFRSWLGIIASLLFIVIVLLRIEDEERMMRDAFGAEWDVYCSRTRRLLPFIY